MSDGNAQWKYRGGSIEVPIKEMGEGQKVISIHLS